MNTHREIREGDEIFCPICGKRWDVNDTHPPKCLSKKEAGLNHIKRIRGKYGLSEVR